MSIRSYLFILFIIFLSSGASVLLLFFYMNPLSDPKIAIILMGTGAFLLCSSAFAPVLFFIKKIYYRGDVSLTTMRASIRQSILMVIGAGAMLFLYSFHLYENRLILTIWATIGCIEVMMQAIE